MSEVPAHWPTDLGGLRGAWSTVTGGIAAERVTKEEAKVAGWNESLSVLVEKRAALVAAGE